MGECEVVGGKVGGMAVTIGARIAALAGPGEVLVSGSVRDLMTGSDRHFEGGEPHELKGVEDPWRVYRLVPEEVDGDAVALAAAVDGAAVHPPAAPPAGRRRWRRCWCWRSPWSARYVLTRTEADVVVGENAVGVIGPGDDPRVERRRPRSGSGPPRVAAGHGSVWVTNSAADSVSRIDPEQQRVGADHSRRGPRRPGWRSARARCGSRTPATPPCRGSTRRPRGSTTIQVRPGPTGIVVAFGSVWVTNALDASVTEIDPDTNKVAGGGAGRGRARPASRPARATCGSPTRATAPSPGSTPTRTRRTRRSRSATGRSGSPSADGAAWVANNLDGSLSRIDVDDLTVTSRTLVKGGGAYGVAAPAATCGSATSTPAP